MFSTQFLTTQKMLLNKNYILIQHMQQIGIVLKKNNKKRNTKNFQQHSIIIITILQHDYDREINMIMI